MRDVPVQLRLGQRDRRTPGVGRAHRSPAVFPVPARASTSSCAIVRRVRCPHCPAQYAAPLTTALRSDDVRGRGAVPGPRRSPSGHVNPGDVNSGHVNPGDVNLGDVNPGHVK
ncbi:pentapeptide repeat-containing protein [Streptomyces sp. NPDC096012]|uniref:pentapeptide repeat-containing protein n=1 Tax=Streptomyces sp. NPDC096012 TaxID=3155684 RepID=UPI00336AE889